MLSFEEFEQKTKLNNYYPYNLTLNLTNNCNLACRYCFVQQQPQTMSLEIAKKSIDFVWNNLQKHKNELKDINDNALCYIVLFGGEPLLTFKSVIKPLFIYIETTYQNYKKDFQFAISTNGTLLTQEIIDFFNKYNIDVLFSFDGLPEIQNDNRPMQNNKNSFDIIMNNYEKFLFNNNNRFNYRLRATADLKHIKLWYDNFLFFYNLPIPEFVLNIEYYTIINDQQKIQIYQQLKKMCDYMYNVFLNDEIDKFNKWGNYIHCLESIILHDYESIIRNDDTNINLIPRFLSNQCGYHLRYIAVDYKGDIFPCREEPAEYHNQCHPTCIGNIDAGIDYSKLNQLKKQINQIEYNFFINKKCDKDCWYANNNIRCEYVECPSHTFKEKNVSISFCIINSYICQQAAQHMYQLINVFNKKEYIKFLRTTFADYNFVYNLLQVPPSLQEFMIKEAQKNIVNKGFGN